jgi:hypothetical protein
MLDAITTAPAIIANNRLNLLAANHLGRAVHCNVYGDPSKPPNFARFPSSTAQPAVSTPTGTWPPTCA